MRETRIIMGMPVTLEVADIDFSPVAFNAVFQTFEDIDARFSTYKPESEISCLNRGEIALQAISPQMQEVFTLAQKTQDETDGYFNILKPDGTRDPSGIVKGWAILKSAQNLEAAGAKNFFIDAGGDIAARGLNDDFEPWRVGIRSPFKLGEIVKVIAPGTKGVATSGTYIRGNHIWNPHAKTETPSDVVSITVIGPDVLEADRFATAAFAMGAHGVHFIEGLPGFEAYQINAAGLATQTTHFKDYVVS